MNFRLQSDGSLIAPARGASPAPPHGYILAPGEKYRYIPILVECDYREQQLKKSSCCGDKTLDYCTVNKTYTTYLMCQQCTKPKQKRIDAAYYQKIYDSKDLNYGSAEHDRCPGTRFLSQYIAHLESPIIDLGCGTGDTVRKLQDNGYVVNGMDWIDRGLNHIVCDITEHQDLSIYKTAICLDVFEHVYEDRLPGLIRNMQQVERQVITVHCGPSREWGFGRDLHVNIKTGKEWVRLLSAYFEFDTVIMLAPKRYLYLTRRKDV